MDKQTKDINVCGLSLREAVATMPSAPQAFFFRRVDDALDQYCRTRDCTIEMLAELLGMSKTTLRDKRYGRGQFKVGELLRIAQLTGQPVEYLIEEVEVIDTHKSEE